MAENWEPSEAQKDGVIRSTCEFIADEVQELMQELGCPPSFIAGILRDIADSLEEGPKARNFEEDPRLDLYV